MRIGVDYRLANRHLGGMAVYLKSLIGQLNVIDKENKYILLDDNPSARKGFKKSAWTIVWEHVWLQLYIPYYIWKQKIQVLYFPNPPISFLILTPSILTIPDVSFMYDSSLPGWTRKYLYLMYLLSAHKAQKITTLSQNSKNDIVRFFKVNPQKIYITPLAAPDEVALQSLTTPRKKKYILIVPGTFIKRKNIEDVVMAFKRLPLQLRTAHSLLIVGHAQGEGFDYIKKFIQAEGLAEKVVYTGRVSNQELSTLYSQAELFVCSSLYEGFGLTILEAMKCGAPVISYNNSSLPEVVGDAGVLVNDVESLALAMKELLESSALRSKWRKLGLLQAKKFTWDHTAREFLQVVGTM